MTTSDERRNPMKRKTTVELKRARVFKTPWATRKRWQTRDDQYAIEGSHIEYGQAGDAYTDAFRVLAKDQYGWTIISRHRKRSAAVRALGKLLADCNSVPPALAA